MADQRFDAIVIGAGEAGTEVASAAVEDGLRVAMIYRSPYGSTCLNVGCIPSKFIIHRARVAHSARSAARYGIDARDVHVRLADIVVEKRRMVDEHRASSFKGAQTTAGLDLIEGSARFVDTHAVEVAGRTLTAAQIFIATGTRPLVPTIDGLERVRFYTNDDVMDLDHVPSHLIVVGGGYIACELGQAFARFGARVTIIQSKPHLIPREDNDASTVVEEALREEGIELVLGAKASSVHPSRDGINMMVRNAAGDDEAVSGSHLLVAAGRAPNTDGLDVSAARVECDGRGYVSVDDTMRTSSPGIWAVGDVNGEQPFTRVCQEEGRVAYENAFDAGEARIDRRSLPHAIFTDPEVASVGLYEDEAREQAYDVATGTVDFDQFAKAEIIGETRGFVKIVVDRSSRELLGCHIAGAMAADLIYDAATVIRRRGSIDDLAGTVGVFPTIHEGVEGTAKAMAQRVLGQDESGSQVATAKNA
jgi:mercury(II) reductase